MWRGIDKFKLVDENSYAVVHKSVHVNSLCMCVVTCRSVNSQSFHKVNVTVPFQDKVWKHFWYSFNKLRYRDRDALLTTPWPPYLKHVLLITIQIGLR